MTYSFLQDLGDPTPPLDEGVSLPLLRMLNQLMIPGQRGWEQDFDALVEAGPHHLTDTRLTFGAKRQIDLPLIALTFGLDNLAREWFARVLAYDPTSRQSVDTLAAALQLGKQDWSDKLFNQMPLARLDHFQTMQLVAGWAASPASPPALMAMLPRLKNASLHFKGKTELSFYTAMLTAAVRADNPVAVGAVLEAVLVDTYWLKDAFRVALNECRGKALGRLLQEQPLVDILSPDRQAIARVVGRGAAERGEIDIDDAGDVKEEDVLATIAALAACPELGPRLTADLTPRLRAMQNREMANRTEQALLSGQIVPATAPARTSRI